MSFMYDLNKIPYDYTMDVMRRFKEVDLEDRVPEELCVEVHTIVHQMGAEIILKGKKNAKSLSQEDLQIAEKRREAKGKGERE